MRTSNGRCIAGAAGVAMSLLMLAMPGVAMAKKTPELLTVAEQDQLKEILKHVKYEASGIDGKPTVQVTGANVQIISGAPGAKESETNGEGNLIIGYDESPGAQTGSNNLMLGEEQTYTSYASILG